MVFWIGNVLNYTDDYVNLTKVRFLVETGKDLDDALVEGGYEK